VASSPSLRTEPSSIGHRSRPIAVNLFDRSGKRLGTLGEAGDLLGVSLSPDRKSVATAFLDPIYHTWDQWLYDIARALRTRLTFDSARFSFTAIWSPDGSRVVFESNRNRKFGLYRRASNLSGGEELLYAEDVRMIPTSWLPDGKLILYSRGGGQVCAIPLSGERKPYPVPQLSVASTSTFFSPDGRWVAYASSESERKGSFLVYYSEDTLLNILRQLVAPCIVYSLLDRKRK
jgi:Tol biopolymer transport system component